MATSNVKRATSYIVTLTLMKNPLQKTRSHPQTDESFKDTLEVAFRQAVSPVSSLNAKLS